MSVVVLCGLAGVAGFVAGGAAMVGLLWAFWMADQREQADKPRNGDRP